MANRNSINQSLHDAVVQASARTYPAAYKVYTNPDGERNYGVNNEYPDVVVLESSIYPSVRLIEEVETEDSVDNGERDNQWKLYASLGYSFHLIVPVTKFEYAKLLIKGLKVDRLWWYTIQNGQISFGP